MNRSVKRETLKLIETFLDKAEDQPHIGKQFVPPMMDPILGDYARNVPDARESEVLSLFATIINKYHFFLPPNKYENIHCLVTTYNDVILFGRLDICEDISSLKKNWTLSLFYTSYSDSSLLA